MLGARCGAQALSGRSGRRGRSHGFAAQICSRRCSLHLVEVLGLGDELTTEGWSTGVTPGHPLDEAHARARCGTGPGEHAAPVNGPASGRCRSSTPRRGDTTSPAPSGRRARDSDDRRDPARRRRASAPLPRLSRRRGSVTWSLASRNSSMSTEARGLVRPVSQRATTDCETSRMAASPRWETSRIRLIRRTSPGTSPSNGPMRYHSTSSAVTPTSSIQSSVSSIPAPCAPVVSVLPSMTPGRTDNGEAFSTGRSRGRSAALVTTASRAYLRLSPSGTQPQAPGSCLDRRPVP